jgi:putative flippase GtrA
MTILTDPRERTRFIKFAVVGTIGFGVDFLTFNLFRSGIGLPAEISNVFSFTAAVISNFLLNRFWTFPDSRSKSVWSQLAQYGVVNVAGLIIRTTIFILIKNPLVSLMETVDQGLPVEAYVIGENMALATVVVIVMFWNFFINRYWTYSDIE